ncbi:hypothetical protein C1X18_30280, partial [Pseudomonas sp. FW305-3-2-15-C-LB1]
ASQSGVDIFERVVRWQSRRARMTDHPSPTSAGEAPPAPGERLNRRRRLWLALGATAAVAVGVLWAERRPIATQLIDRKLAEWRVPARYR